VGACSIVAEKKEKTPGAPSAFGDRQGGPGNIGGVDFQIRYVVFRTLEWLHAHWGDTTGTGAVRCEPRLIHLPIDGEVAQQHGFDVAVTGWSNHKPEYLELKRSPSEAEVIDLVATMSSLPIGIDRDLEIGLVSERSTADYRRLERLHGYTQEAVSDAELETLVAAVADVKLTALLKAAGDSPWAVLGGMRAPELRGESTLTEQIRWLAATLAGGEDAGELLVDRLLRVITVASKRRESLSLPELHVRLVGDELMQPAPAAGAPENADLASIHTVLETCPMPVPRELLARALRMSVAELEAGVLRPSLESQAVLESDGGWYRVPHPGSPLTTEFAEPLAGDLLAVYVRLAADLNDKASGHTLNALSLARICQDTRPEVVARMFKAFDKGCKRWGDIDVVLELANRSEKAVLVELDKELTETERRDLAYVRAQTYICGQGWVMQRVDELPLAVRHMEDAKEISVYYRDDVNHAFTLKCEGRLQRMLAERERDPEERERLLRLSAELLREAETVFGELVQDPDPDKNRLGADHGECPSLLARTLALSGDLHAARVEAGRAEELLAKFSNSKQYADLKILQAEMFLRGDQAAVGYEDDRAVHRAVLIELAGGFDTDGSQAPAGRDRSASEIAARLHHTIGLLDRDVDPTAAQGAFQRAAELYGVLDYRGGREESLMHARLMAGEILPDGLGEILDEVDASPGVRLLVMDRAKDLSTASGAGARLGESSSEGSISDDQWRDIVQESQAKHTAQRPRWDKRASA